MSINTKPDMEEAILQSATRLFLDKGFASTSTTEIAKDAGCNQALVHYYYRTKDRLFEAIFLKKMKVFVGSLLEINREDLPFEEKLTRRIESHFDIIKEDPKLPLFFFNEMSSNPKRLESLKSMLGDLPSLALQQMQEELDVEIANGNVKPMTVFDLLLTIISLNLMVFIAEPMFKAITKIPDDEFIALRERRKKENVQIILKSLKS